MLRIEYGTTHDASTLNCASTVHARVLDDENLDALQIDALPAFGLSEAETEFTGTEFTFNGSTGF